MFDSHRVHFLIRFNQTVLRPSYNGSISRFHRGGLGSIPNGRILDASTRKTEVHAFTYSCVYKHPVWDYKIVAVSLVWDQKTSVRL